MLELLAVQSGKTYVDATLGMGGHAEAILTVAGTRLIGIDQDAEAVDLAKTRLERFGERVTIVHSNFSEIKEVVSTLKFEKVDGILADLGVSSLQLDSEERGFRFRSDAPLDMRMDRSSGDSAADLLAESRRKEIANVIYQYGEERFSRRVSPGG